MQHLHQPVSLSGRVEFRGARRALIEAGFDLNLFKCEAEIELAVREIDRVSETELVTHFGATPAWVIGDRGPFIGRNGVLNLIRAFELGRQLCLDTVEWMIHLTSVEVIDMLPMLEERARIQNFN
ncbi:MAG: hypothetical protein NTX72_06090 [Candidatus Uhrbacteria bacterium]|nr:hypothetical protein [Candidatus Uhrbacteria bacterium]